MEPEDTTVADEVTDTDTIAVPQFKEDINAFSVPIDEEADFISRMPSEVLDEILSYLALDHDPDRAVKKHAAETTKGYYYEPSHVLLSVAAMSSRFRGHVEDFAQRQLTMHAEKYYFHSNEQLAERDNDKPRRRSERLKSKGVLETRCYRLELVRALQLQCMVCNRVTGYRDTMNNGVACCRNCARARSNETIVSSSDLLARLRDGLGQVLPLTERIESHQSKEYVRAKGLDAHFNEKSTPQGKACMASNNQLRHGAHW